MTTITMAYRPPHLRKDPRGDMWRKGTPALSEAVKKKEIRSPRSQQRLLLDVGAGTGSDPKQFSSTWRPRKRSRKPGIIQQAACSGIGRKRKFTPDHDTDMADSLSDTLSKNCSLGSANEGCTVPRVSTADMPRELGLNHLPYSQEQQSRRNMFDASNPSRSVVLPTADLPHQVDIKQSNATSEQPPAEALCAAGDYLEKISDRSEKRPEQRVMQEVSVLTPKLELDIAPQSGPNPPEDDLSTLSPPPAAFYEPPHDSKMEHSLRTIGLPGISQNPTSDLRFLGQSDILGHELHPALRSEWQQIHRLRQEIASLQSQVHSLRKDLRERQAAKSKADDAYMRHLSMQEFGRIGRLSGLSGLKADIKETENLRLACQIARNEYGPVEDECNQLEDQLVIREFELSQRENIFYSLWKQPTDSIDLDLTTTEIMEYPNLSQIYGTKDEIADLHPLVVEFQDKQGDLDILREHLDELLDEESTLEDSRMKRDRFGMTLSPEDQAWLDNSQNAKDEVQRDIRKVEIEVDRLKQECLAKGLIDEYGEPTNFKRDEESSFEKEMDIDARGQYSEYVKFPKLLPPPLSRERDYIDYRLGSDDDSLEPSNIINKWLLQMLRTSALNVYLLASMAEKANEKLGTDWQWLVLQSWCNDGSTEYPTQVWTASLTTQAPPLISSHSDTSSASSDPDMQYLPIKRSASVGIESDSEKTRKASPKSPKATNSRKTI